MLPPSPVDLDMPSAASEDQPAPDVSSAAPNDQRGCGSPSTTGTDGTRLFAAAAGGLGSVWIAGLGYGAPHFYIPYLPALELRSVGILECHLQPKSRSEGSLADLNLHAQHILSRKGRC